MSIDFGRPMGRRVTVTVCIVCALLFLVVGGRLTIFGSVPSYLLVMTACCAYIEGERTGCIAGFIAGLATDLLGSGPIGLSCLLMCMVGYVLGYGRRDYLASGWTRPLAYFLLADVFVTTVYMAIASFMGSVALDAGQLAGTIVSGVVSDLLVAAVVFLVANRVMSKRTTRMNGLYLS